MKKIFWIILITLIIAFGALMLFSPTLINNKPAFLVDEGVSLGLESEQSKTELLEWQNYKNDEYGFSIKYPSEWESQETLKPQEIRALHDIIFFESKYEIHRASLIVRIFDNSENESIDDWWNAWLSDEDLKKEECITEYGEGNAPCLFLRDTIESDKSELFAGLSARTVKIFRFDREEECTYVAQVEYIYGVCSDSENPNDPEFIDNKSIYSEMRSSFILEQIIVQNEPHELLRGAWMSKGDEKSTMVFKDEAVLEELYNEKLMNSGSWEIVSRAKRGDGEEIEGSFLHTNIDGEDYYYTIINLDNTELTLTYLARGNTLEFIRIIN